MLSYKTWLMGTLAAGAALALGVAACSADTSTFGGPGSNGGTGGGAGSSGTGGGAGQGGGETSAGGGGQGGGTSASGTGGQGGEAPCDAFGDPCSECMVIACPELFCGCFASPPCAALSVCFAGCGPGDEQCRQECWTANPDGISLGALTSHCGATECPAECPGQLELDACQVCLFTSCSTQMNACLSNPECFALIQCLEECTPSQPGCEGTCFGVHWAGAQDANNVNSCMQPACPSECG